MVISIPASTGSNISAAVGVHLSLSYMPLLVHGFTMEFQDGYRHPNIKSHVEYMYVAIKSQNQYKYSTRPFQLAW